MRGQRAEHGIAHIRQSFIIAEIAWPDQRDAALVESALNELPGKARGLRGGDKNKKRLRGGFLDALQKRREIRVAQRHTDGFRDVTAGGLVVVGEAFLGLEPGSEFRD